jgi:DNA polymerase
MRFVVADWETYFDSKSYTLSKMTTESYVRDPRFAAHGVAIKWGPDHAARWYDERQARQVLADEDWSDVMMIHHHAQFDSLIESYHYNVHPKMIGCTLSMARMILGNHLSVSLDSVRKHYGMPAKRTPYHLFGGKHWHELAEQERASIADGACDEAESIWKIFGLLMREFPASELEVIDITVRMFTEPVLQADIPLLRKVWEDEDRRKVALRSAIAVTESELQSADKFCQLLEAAGVEPVYKTGKNGDIPALAKTDDFMRELLESEDEYVRALAEARIGAKSTLLQSRAEYLGHMAARGALCMYLRYCGAHTTRWSGGDGGNPQNYKRGSALRRAVCAPDGYQLLVIDLAQTECRILNFLAGQKDVIERFRAGHDPYVGNASIFYGREITRADEAERGTGKQLELSCGFGCGGPKFKRTAALGIYGPPVSLSDEAAQRAVDLYRSTHRAVLGYWREAGNQLSWINGGLEKQWGPLRIAAKKVWLPNGTRINYDTLEWYVPNDDDINYALQTGNDYVANDGRAGWRLKTRQGWSKMYDAKLVEHVVQALARVQMSDAMLRLNRAGFRPVMTSHDDVAVLIKDDEHVDETVQFCTELVKQEPAWLPGLPLDAEASVGQRYEK